MLARLTLPLFCLSALFLVGCSNSEDPIARLKPFQGSWSFLSLDEKGTKADEAHLKRIGVVIVKDKIHMVKDDKVMDEFILRVDPTKKPGEIDFVVMTGAEQGGTHLGIFEFEDDTLKICSAGVGKGRPSAFASKAGTTWAYYVLKRKQ